jgi:asparagine synthase (glutamine-hydrolysing)
MRGIYGIYDGETVQLKGEKEDCFKMENLCITFYGEIHNSVELRNSLEKVGYKFVLGIYPELVAYAYMEWGEECPKRFNGTFSFCVYDKDKKILFVARDQVGIKLLYYIIQDGRFSFSSDLNTLTLETNFPREVDLRALNFFLTYRYIPEELAIFKNVRKLPPACSMSFDLESRELEIRKYWNPPIVEAITGEENELLDELENLIISALEIRMEGAGVFLSGGLDSSILVALMTKLLSNRVKTICVGFHDKKYSELPFARMIAEKFGTDHTEFIVEPDFDDFLKSASIFDEPLGDPSILPTYYAGKIAGDFGIDIVAGDGADSHFLGNKFHYQVIRYGEINKYIRPPLDRILKGLVRLVPREAKWRIYLENRSVVEFYRVREVVFNEYMRERLLQEWVLTELNNEISKPEMRWIRNSGTITEIMSLTTFTSNEDILFKNERVSNHFSYHVRTPFLDTRVNEFAFGKVPGNLKIRNGVLKYLLKKLGMKYLPSNFPFERSKGFNPPFGKWMRREWREQVRDILLSGKDDFFKKSYIEFLLKQNEKPFLDQDRKLFSLLVFKIWERRYLNNGR